MTHQAHEIDHHFGLAVRVGPERLDLPSRKGQRRIHREPGHLFRWRCKLPHTRAVLQVSVKKPHGLEEAERLRSFVQSLLPRLRRQISGRYPALGSHSLSV